MQVDTISGWMAQRIAFLQTQQAKIEAALSVGIGLLLWEIVVWAFTRTDLIVVPPSAIVQAFMELLRSGALQKHIWVSFTEFSAGYLLAAFVGIPVGMLMGRSRALRGVLEPWVIALYATPTIALAPLFIVWLGIGLASKVGIVFLVSVFPILVNSQTGVRMVDVDLVDAALAAGANRRQVFFKVLVPGAFPFLVTGLRLGVGRALIGVVVGELVGAQAGLGYLIAVSAQTFDTASLFVGVVIFAFSGILANEGLKYLEMRIAPWRENIERGA